MYSHHTPYFIVYKDTNVQTRMWQFIKKTHPCGNLLCIPERIKESIKYQRNSGILFVGDVSLNFDRFSRFGILKGHHIDMFFVNCHIHVKTMQFDTLQKIQNSTKLAALKLHKNNL